MNNLEKQGYDWVANDLPPKIADEYYCSTRDIFQARLDKMTNFLLAGLKISESDAYIFSAIAGEIGNNSFDHNLGNWPDTIGIFFGYEADGDKLSIVLADRGIGVFQTLKRVKPELKDDSEALVVAFNEKISGRAPEPRGNGLKFVKENIRETKKHLVFISKTAKAELNKEMIVTSTEKINGCLAIITN